MSLAEIIEYLLRPVAIVSHATPVRPSGRKYHQSPTNTHRASQGAPTLKRSSYGPAKPGLGCRRNGPGSSHQDRSRSDVRLTAWHGGSYRGGRGRFVFYVRRFNMAEGTATRKTVVRKNFKSPDETRKFDKGKIDIANVGDAVIGRFELQPGWRWSQSVKPLVGNACRLCRFRPAEDEARGRHRGRGGSGRRRLHSGWTRCLGGRQRACRHAGLQGCGHLRQEVAKLSIGERPRPPRRGRFLLRS